MEEGEGMIMGVGVPIFISTSMFLLHLVHGAWGGAAVDARAQDGPPATAACDGA